MALNKHTTFLTILIFFVVFNGLIAFFQSASINPGQYYVPVNNSYGGATTQTNSTTTSYSGGIFGAMGSFFGVVSNGMGSALSLTNTQATNNSNWGIWFSFIGYIDIFSIAIMVICLLPWGIGGT